MMQAADPGECDDLAEFGRLDAAVIRRVLAQGEAHSVLVVPVAELAKQAPRGYGSAASRYMISA